MEDPERVQSISRSASKSESWGLFGRRVSKTETVFFSQIIIIYIVIVTCIINLSLERGNSNLWTSLLSSSLGYLLPNPKIKSKRFYG